MADSDGVQPDAGQGATGQPDSPYAEYLDRIPQDVRGDVEPVFKDWDANVTRRFQEASEYRKQWEPYENVGVKNYDPQAIEWSLQFYNALDNPEVIKQWYEQYADQKGIARSAAPAPAAGPSGFDPADPFADPFANPADQFKQALSPIEQQLAQLNQWRQAQEEQARVDAAQRQIRQQMDEIKTKHPDDYNEEAINKLIANYAETDPRNAVQRAFQDWQSIVNQIQKDTLQDKVNAPPPAESGGLPDGAPEQIRTLADANRIALERFRIGRAG